MAPGHQRKPNEAQLKLDNNQMAAVVSAYAPTLDSEENIKKASNISASGQGSREDTIILKEVFNTLVLITEQGVAVLGKRILEKSTLLGFSS